MQPQIISLSFDPVQVVGFHKKKAAFVGNGNSFQVFFLTSELLQQLRQFRIRNVRSSQLQAAPGAEQGYTKALLGKRFEQIIQGLGVKRLQGVLIIGGDEDSQRHVLDADGANHLEAVHLRHLNIEEHEVGMAGEDGLDRLVAVATFSSHLKFWKWFQELSYAAASQRFIIRDEHFVLHSILLAVQCSFQFEGWGWLSLQTRPHGYCSW